MFLNSPSIMRARRLQEAFTRSILPFSDQENASSSQRSKTLAKLFNDCSSLSVSETPSPLDSWGDFWDLQPENEGGNLISFDTAIDGWVEPQLLWCWKLPVLIKYNICIISALRFSLFHLALAYYKTESSSLFFVGFIVVVEEIYTSVACDIGDIFWT